MSVEKYILGWVRDKKGNVLKRPLMNVCNCITSMSGGGHIGPDGMGNTTPYVLEQITK